jgi:hypothetical protein
MSITLTTGATILNGSALARNGAVTLDTNTIINAVPEPATLTLALLGAALLGVPAFARRGRGRRAREGIRS